MTGATRPRVVLLVDRPDWAFDFVARALAERLAARFEFRVLRREVEPVELDPEEIDLLYVFFWGDRSFAHLGLPSEKVVREVASWRWALRERWGRLSAPQFTARHLSDCATVTVPSRALLDALRSCHPRVLHVPNGVDLRLFHPGERTGDRLSIGWAGNPDDDSKGLHDVLAPACTGRFALDASDGRRSQSEIANLYRRSDVIAIASEAESQPLPLLEGMASGCFPVVTNVGIVPELVVHGVNGLVVERSPEAFREAFAWCERNLDAVRRAGRLNAALIAEERGWDSVAGRFGDVLDAVLGRAPAPPAEAAAQHGPAREALERAPLLIQGEELTVDGARVMRVGTRAPRVSVVMPMRDAAAHVVEALESILAQSFRDFEFLIFDDGSKDDSREIVESYAKADARIRLFRGSAVGLAVWLREGVARARGELIARMDADDVSHPERFARQVRYLDSHPECVAVGTQILIVDPERRPIQFRDAPLEHEAIDAALLEGRADALPHSSAMFRRSALLAAGNYRTDRLWHEDVDLLLRLAEIGRLANLPEVLLEYRRHPRAVGAAHRREQRVTLKRILADAARRRGLAAETTRVLPDLPSTSIEDLWHGWARGALGGGYRSTARHYARLLFRAEPFSLRSWRLLIRAALGFSLHGIRKRRATPGDVEPDR